MSESGGAKDFKDRLAEPATVDDVIATLRELVEDLEAHPEAWENPTLDRYLDAMQAWLEAMQDDVRERPSWRLIVMMLRVAKRYE